MEFGVAKPDSMIGESSLSPAAISRAPPFLTRGASHNSEEYFLLHAVARRRRVGEWESACRSGETGTHQTSCPRNTADFSRGGIPPKSVRAAFSRCFSEAHAVDNVEKCCDE